MGRKEQCRKEEERKRVQKTEEQGVGGGVNGWRERGSLHFYRVLFLASCSHQERDDEVSFHCPHREPVSGTVVITQGLLCQRVDFLDLIHPEQKLECCASSTSCIAPLHVQSSEGFQLITPVIREGLLMHDVVTDTDAAAACNV